MSQLFRILLPCIVLVALALPSTAQVFETGDVVTYEAPKSYQIGGVTVHGTQFLDPNALILLSGLTVGDRITVPGDGTAEAVQNLWDQGLFEDVQIGYTHTRGENIFLTITVKELPRILRFGFRGISKSDQDNLREEIGLASQMLLTQSLIKQSEQRIKNYYVNKSYLNTSVQVLQKPDSLDPSKVELLFKIRKNERVRIKEITINGNEALGEMAVQRSLKETKERSRVRPFHKIDRVIVGAVKAIVKPDSMSAAQIFGDHLQKNMRVRVFKSSKFLNANLEGDKQGLVAKYNAKGYRDAKVVSDTMYQVDRKNVNVDITIDEGDRYYYRNITWVGNSIKSTKRLEQILSIDSGDVYNKSLMESRLYSNPSGLDITSEYMDKGYLFFQINPVEVLVENDQIDIEMRIYEGKQAVINKVTVIGNTKTNDHVIMREIRTKPGQLFSRSDIIRTQSELAKLGYFDPEGLGVVPKPNPQDGTVDIEYTVAERSSDQLELSGGWGGGTVVGTLGLSFTNFSMRSFLKKGAWRPIPSGDGQRLSIRAQTNGTWFQSYNISFTEPWLGGKKPNALSITGYYSVQTNGQRNRIEVDGVKVDNPDRRDLKILGLTAGLGKRLTWPDDYFTLQQEVTYQNFNINNWQNFVFENGRSNNLFYRLRLSRSSTDQIIYPTMGADMSFSLQATAPYSLFNGKDYTDPGLLDEERYKWVEYHKWKFTSSWYSKIVGKLVLNSKVGFGFLSSYNQDVGPAPFERFYLGGSGLTGFNLDGREIIALRGYDDQKVSTQTGGTIISKYTMELRYPLSTNPNATIYTLGFLEAGNTWNSARTYNPFEVKRSGGVGVRLFLPMFGLLGLDWGYRFDDIPEYPNMQRSQVHFTIGMNLGEL